MLRLRTTIVCCCVTAAVCFTGADRAAAQSERPTQEATRVEVAVVLLDLEAVDDTAQSFAANVYLLARWNDPRLAHEGPGARVHDLDDVWNPHLQVVNQRQISLTLPRVVSVTPDGQVTYRQRAVGSFTQRLDLVDYPLDRQTFEIRLVAVGYSPEEVAFVANADLSSSVAPELTIPDRTISKVRAGPRAYQPLPEAGPVAGYVLGFEARRKLGYFFSKIVFPLLLVVGMSLMVLWIDPEVANPRVGIPVTSMLTVIAYRFMVVNMVPRISYLTRLDLFILSSTVLVFLTLVESAWSVMATRRDQGQKALVVDRTVRWVFPVAYLLSFSWAFLV